MSGFRRRALGWFGAWLIETNRDLKRLECQPVGFPGKTERIKTSPRVQAARQQTVQTDLPA
jgi:hypothetical protein